MQQEHIANTEDNELTLVPDPFLEVSCPFLGVRDDPATPMGYPTPDNQCYALKRALSVGHEKQRTHCLTDCYTDCLYYQQQLSDMPAERGGASAEPRFLRRFVNGRTLALGMMLILILLAVLIWWPPPGTSMEEGTVFGVSFNLNSPNVAEDSEETADQPVVTQEIGSAEQPNPAVAVEERVDEAQQQEASAEAGEKVDEVTRSNTLEKSVAQGVTLNSPAVKIAEEEPAAEPAATIAENAPLIGETVEEKEEDTAPEIGDSGSPDDQQVDLSPVVDNGNRTEKKGQFTPVVYGDQGSDDEMLNVYQDPDVTNGYFTKIARPEMFNLLGRDETAEWVKINTESGIEGWVLISDTALGSWIETLPELGPE